MLGLTAAGAPSNSQMTADPAEGSVFAQHSLHSSLLVSLICVLDAAKWGPGGEKLS